MISDEHGRAVRVAGLAAWLRRVAPTRARGVVSVALVGDRRIKDLNRRYRRKDAVTDVLSFPNSSSVSSVSSVVNSFLGDVVIARGVARRQAREAHHPELTELKILALHGLLHLLGYDHEGDTGQMQRVEQRLRRKGGLREGLIERGHGSRTARR